MATVANRDTRICFPNDQRSEISNLFQGSLVSLLSIGHQLQEEAKGKWSLKYPYLHPKVVNLDYPNNTTSIVSFICQLV